jgi:hypothetical protein
MNMPRVKETAGQMAVKIPRFMHAAIDEFLQTDKAKRLGLDSKADVATMAVREFLQKYGMYEV